MSYTSTHHTALAPLADVFARFFATAMNGFARIGENNPRMRQVAALSALSDEQLARRGLSREDIARRVYAGFMYV